jgi:hypothetical protein
VLEAEGRSRNLQNVLFYTQQLLQEGLPYCKDFVPENEAAKRSNQGR